MMNTARAAVLAVALLAALAACSTDDPDAPEISAKPLPDLPAAGADASQPALDPRALPLPRPPLPAMPDLHGGTLVITDAALAAMNSAGVPGAVTQRLQPLKGRAFRNPANFLAALEDRIGTENLIAHRGVIVRHALSVQDTSALPPPPGEADLTEAESLQERPVVAVRARVVPPPEALPGSAPPPGERSKPLPSADRLVTGKVSAPVAGKSAAPAAAAASTAKKADGAQSGRSVYFAANRANVTRPNRNVIDAHAKELLRNSARQVRIEGHADVRGGDKINLPLSRRRAEAVRDILKQKGVPDERMEAIGLGSSRPAHPANTPQAWAKNRRVEIVPK